MSKDIELRMIKDDPNHDEWSAQIAAYATDTLPVEEKEGVETHIGICPPCAQLLRELRDVASSLSFFLSPVKPPADLRATIHQRIATEGPERSSLSATNNSILTRQYKEIPLPVSKRGVPEIVTTNSNGKPLILKNQEKSAFKEPLPLSSSKRGWNIMPFGAIAAAFILFVGASAGLLTYQGHNQDTMVAQKDQQIAALNGNLLTMNTGATMVSYQMATARVGQENMAKIGMIMSAPDTQMMTLQPSRSDIVADGKLIFSPSRHESAIMVSHIPVVEANYCYQVWLMHKGQPISGGLFSANETGQPVVMMLHPEDKSVNADNADLLEITLEPRNGSTAPTASRAVLSVAMPNH